MKYTIINCATNKRLTYSVHVFVNLVVNLFVAQFMIVYFMLAIHAYTVFEPLV
jgi:hypothetical protein